MNIYIKPIVFVITVDETPLLAGSGSQKRFNISGVGGGDGGTNGPIRTIGDGEAQNGAVFAKQYTSSFDDDNDDNNMNW